MVAESQRGANQAGKLADAVSTAADAKMATPEAAARAREEADKKDAQLVIGVILSVLPCPSSPSSSAASRPELRRSRTSCARPAPPLAAQQQRRPQPQRWLQQCDPAPPEPTSRECSQTHVWPRPGRRAGDAGRTQPFNPAPILIAGELW